MSIVQPSLAHAFLSFAIAFQPPDTVLNTVYDLYVSNSQCRLKERKRFDSVRNRFRTNPPGLTSIQFEWPKAFSCSLLLDPQIRTVYTKHPATGEVATHTHPFPHLPKFTVSAAHPALLTLQGTKFRISHFCSDRHRDTDILRKLIIMRSTYTIHPSFTKDWSAYWIEEDVGAPAEIASVKHKTLANANVAISRGHKSHPTSTSSTM